MRERDLTGVWSKIREKLVDDDCYLCRCVSSCLFLGEMNRGHQWGYFIHTIILLYSITNLLTSRACIIRNLECLWCKMEEFIIISSFYKNKFHDEELWNFLVTYVWMGMWWGWNFFISSCGFLITLNDCCVHI